MSIVITLLSSVVVSAVISGLISLLVNKKELEVKLRLDEKNKWIENVTLAHHDYIINVSSYKHDLMSFSLEEISRLNMAKSLNEVNRAYYSLTFLLYQAEYMPDEVLSIKDIIQEIEFTLDNQKKAVMEYRTGKLNRNLLEKEMHTAELKTAKFLEELSKEIASLVRNEKQKMISGIIRMKRLKKIKVNFR